VSKEILIQMQKGERHVAIIENGRVEDFHIEVDHYQSLLGNVYKGKVESILPSINAAFVNIGQRKNGFLYLTDAASPRIDDPAILEPQNIIEKIFKKAPPKPAVKKPEPKKRYSKKKIPEIPLKIGEEILVQVVKDPFGEKGARLTTHITMPGRFIVYMPYDKQTGISKKIEDQKERQRLREIIKEFGFAKTGGFIIRTASREQGKRELVRDAKWLYSLWVEICKKERSCEAPSLIWEERGLTLRIVRDYLTDRIDKLVIDSKEEYFKIKKFAQEIVGKEMAKKIFCYRGKIPLFDSRNITKDLSTVYDKTVSVKSGAYIVIEPTEGLIVVDVNSGRFKAKASPGDAAFMVNMDVVPEIARQLRLRDLGGIIVVDFIDMVKEDHKRKIVAAMQRELTKDHAKTEVYKTSPLGLVQMTRARTGKNIESLSFGKCPYCAGRGHVKIV
jgi:ribonuclease G